MGSKVGLGLASKRSFVARMRVCRPPYACIPRKELLRSECCDPIVIDRFGWKVKVRCEVVTRVVSNS